MPCNNFVLQSVSGEEDRRSGGVVNMATPHRRCGSMTSGMQLQAAIRSYVGNSLTGLQDVSEGRVGEVGFSTD